MSSGTSPLSLVIHRLSFSVLGAVQSQHECQALCLNRAVTKGLRGPRFKEFFWWSQQLHSLPTWPSPVLKTQHIVADPLLSALIKEEKNTHQQATANPAAVAFQWIDYHIEMR